jgi:glycosyltransferase involved in cell wall biosynthesis
MSACRPPYRLAFLIRDLGHGGAQRQLVTLASALARKTEFDVHVVHFHPGPFELDLKQAGVKTICVGKQHRWDLFGFFGRLLTTFRRLRPQVIHGYLHESNLMALFLKPFCGFPRVIWGIRDSQTDADTWGLLGKCSFRLNCLFSGWADQVIANSHAGRAYYLCQGYPEAHFAVIPNGIDSQRLQPQPRQTHGNTFALIGRLHPMKDHSTFLRALALTPEAKAVIIGNGDAAYAADMHALADSLDLSDRLEWQPAQNDLSTLYPTFDALVSTSAYGEGFSNVIGEAMACGLPCITSDVGDSAWLLNAPEWTFPASDHECLAQQMRRFLALKPDERQQLSHANRQRIEDNFTVDQMVERTVKLIRTRHQILWITTGLGTGGAERMLTQLITGLSGYQHTVISLTIGGKYIEPIRATGATVHTLDMPAGKPTLTALWRLFRLAKQIKPDTTMGWMYHGCLAAVMVKTFRLGRGRVIWNVRQSIYDFSHEKRGSALVIKALAKLAFCSEIITYNSKLSARQHEAFGYPQSQTKLIPNGFDLDKWAPLPAEASTLKSGSTSFYIGRFGRYSAMKDYPTFLEAAALITQELPDTQFLLVGTGVDPANSELTDRISQLSLDDCVQLLGEREDLPELTASLDLVVSSSAFGEGFPNVIGEAMACGIPIVATDIGDTAWVVGETGRLVPAGDPQALATACLDTLKLSADQRHQLGMAGRQRIADHFSLRSVLTQFEELLQPSTKN